MPRGDRVRRGEASSIVGIERGRGHVRIDLKGGNRRGGPRGGGISPPRGKTRIYLDSHLNVRTCCCKESMETSLITTMGRTWTGESQTTLYGSVVGAG